MNRLALLTTALGFTLALGGCRAGDKSADAGPVARPAEAVAVLEPTTGNTARGTVRFYETNGKVKILADLAGLKPNSAHGFHVHEGTECGPDGMAAGDHYNPENHPHGLPPNQPRHAGDFGNIHANAQGIAHYELTVENVTINGQKNPIVGHALIVHADPDTGVQPTGASGARIACGIIKMIGTTTQPASAGQP